MTDPPPALSWLRGLRALLLPAVLFSVALGALVFAFVSQMRAQEQYDQAALREWLEEARVFRSTLARLVNDYLNSPPGEQGTRQEIVLKHLSELGDITQTYQGQLPLFPTIYSFELVLPRERLDPNVYFDKLVWESPLPRRKDTMQWLEVPLRDGDEYVGTLRMCYQLHAYAKQQQAIIDRQKLRRWLIPLAGGMALLAVGWGYVFLRREREREVRQLTVERHVEHAEKLVLEKEVRRQEAEHKKDEAERRLLEQRFVTEEAERKALEMKSQLYASIGIMAGSYAHNIKNLLVRPNDLIRRCLDADGLAGEQRHMLDEVNDTLHTVTERLQQILKTVRRDPTRSELAPVDLNDIAHELVAAWEPMATDKWKLTLRLKAHPEPLVIAADRSHLVQAIENLVFNARDATYEMRNHVRDQARRETDLDETKKRVALIQAAAWRGEVVVRTRRADGEAILEVADNGIGMTDEVRRRCTETHFSTKRNNASFEGDTTGMGLGLSFVQTILEAQQGELEIESRPLQGATFRMRFKISAVPVAADGV